MDREEKLGRALCEVYGLKCSFMPQTDAYGYVFNVVDAKRRFFLTFRSWHEFLFGCSLPEDRSRLFQSINYYLDRYYHYLTTVEFSSLDELDLKLTLMGRNPK